MFSEKILIIILTVLLLSLGRIVLADFGISPPLIINDRLLPGSHFEEEINLTRAETKGTLKVEIQISAPEIEKWLSFEKGKVFEIPEGQKETQIKVLVDIPKKAKTGTHDGYLTLRATPRPDIGKTPPTSGVGGLVANVLLNFKVIEEEISDFQILNLDIPDIKKGQPIKVLLRIENLGNVEVAFSKIVLDIYDISQKEVLLLKSLEKSDLEKVEPFKTKEISNEFPMNLEVGRYLAEVRIFKDEEVLKEKKIIFSMKETEKEIKTEGEEEQESQGLTLEIPTFLYYYVLAGFFLIAGLIFLARKRTARKLLDSKKKKKAKKKKKSKKAPARPKVIRVKVVNLDKK